MIAERDLRYEKINKPFFTADNVALEDKGTLEDALKDLTDALENNGDNYTETEKAELQDKIDGLKEALDVIEKVGTVKDLIDQLPDPEKVKLSDKKAIASAKDAYDKLSGYEKTLVDKDELDEVVKAFEKLSENTSSPDTSDSTHVALWFVLMLSAAFGTVGLSIYSKKKKAR